MNCCRIIKNPLFVRLIQGNERFNYYNLREIRYFIKCLQLVPEDFIIRDDAWNTAIDNLARQFAESRDLPGCLRLLKDFEETNTKYKYVSDFYLFLQELKEADFYEAEQGVISVSTIHKSKGREFDCVVLYLKNFQLRSEEDKRTLYVGMTRARDRLIERLSLQDHVNAYNACNRIILPLLEEGSEAEIMVIFADIVMRISDV